MKLWKVDQERGEVREVEAEPYPGRDEEGDEVFDNTHLPTRARAITVLMDNAEAGVSLAARAVQQARQSLERAKQLAADECESFARAREFKRRVELAAGPSGRARHG